MRKVVGILIAAALVLVTPLLAAAGDGERGPVLGHGGGELL